VTPRKSVSVVVPRPWFVVVISGSVAYFAVEDALVLVIRMQLWSALMPRDRDVPTLPSSTRRASRVSSTRPVSSSSSPCCAKDPTVTNWRAGPQTRASSPRREKPHPSVQLSLFEESDGWRYQLLATNTPGKTAQFLQARHRPHARVVALPLPSFHFA
jgi:hypothetical protein